MVATNLVCVLLHLVSCLDPFASQDPGTQQEPDKPRPEQILEALRRGARNVEPVRPIPQDPGAAQPKSPILPEGTPVPDRSGRLDRRGEDWVFVFDGDESRPPMHVLPNSILERMIRQSQAAPNPPVFVISGYVTEFFGENHLLIVLAMQRLSAQNITK